MDPNEVLTGLRVPNTDNWYMIGHGASRVTVLTQQVRALNLAWAIAETSTGEARKIVVIGGGAAGLTASAALATKGHDVTVLERCAELMPLQRNCTKRYLHPHVFDWPDPKSDDTDAGLPILNWRAGWARDVALTIEDGFERCRKSAEGPLTVYRLTSDIEIDTPSLGNLTFKHSRTKEHLRLAYDILIFALGFGLEEAELVGKSSSYWADDSLDQHGIANNAKHLISGLGDGALIDTFRLLLPELHPDLTRLLHRVFGDKEHEVRSWAKETEKLAEDQPVDRRGEFLYNRYSEFDKSEFAKLLDAELGSRMRRDIQVTLLCQDLSPFSLGSRPLHRLLFSRLLFQPDSLLKVHYGRTFRTDQCKVLPGRYIYSPTDGIPGESFDRLIVRHGLSLDVTTSIAKLHELVAPDADGNRWKADIGPEPLFDRERFLSQGGAFNGSGGPDIEDYRGALIGHNFWMPSIRAKVMVSDFAEIALELRPLDLNEEQAEAKSEQRGSGPRKDGEKADRHKDDEPDPTSERGKPPDWHKETYADRRRLPTPGVSFVPSISSWDFSRPAIVKGGAGSGKTTLLKSLIRRHLENAARDSEMSCPVVVLQDSIRLLELYDDIERALVAAALHSAEVSNLSRAQSQLAHQLATSGGTNPVTIFLDGVESCTSRTLNKAVAYAKEKHFPLILMGRKIPKIEQLPDGTRGLELMGLVPGQEAKLLAAHSTSVRLEQLGGTPLPTIPFQLVLFLAATEETRKPPQSLLEAYRIRLQRFDATAVEQLAALSTKTLLGPNRRLSIPVENLGSILQIDPLVCSLFSGATDLEFAHLSYGEFLAAQTFSPEQLMSQRVSLRATDEEWQNRLDVLAMAHAQDARALETALAELEASEPDPLLTQASGIFRALKLGGFQTKSFFTQHINRLEKLITSILLQPSGRFGRREVELAQDILDATGAHHQDLELGALQLSGDPAAMWWIFGARERLMETERPDVHWWQMSFREASKLIQNGVGLEALLDWTKGGDSWTRRRAVETLGLSRPRLLATESHRWRGDLLESGLASPHVLELLVDENADNRIACWRTLLAHEGFEELRPAIGAALRSRDPDKNVRKVVESADPSRYSELLRSFLTPRNSMSSHEQSVFGKVLASEGLKPQHQESLRAFITEGSPWFLDEDDWKLLQRTPWFIDTIRALLGKDIPRWCDVLAALQVPELSADLVGLSHKWLSSNPNLDLLEHCVRALPHDDANAQTLRKECLERLGPSHKVGLAAIRGLASDSNTHALVLARLREGHSPGLVQAALDTPEFAVTNAGQDLALRVIEQHLDEKSTFEERWHNCINTALATIRTSSASQDFWKARYKNLLDPAGNDAYAWAYRRSGILKHISLTQDDVFSLLESEWEMEHRIVEEPRLFLYRAIDWDSALSPRRERLCDYAIREKGSNSQKLLWDHLKQEPEVRQHIQRLARPDRWDLRFAYFATRSQTQEGRTELLELAEKCVGRQNELLDELIVPLGRDPDARTFLTKLLAQGSAPAVGVMELLSEDSDISNVVRTLVQDPKWLRRLPTMGRSGHIKHFSRDENVQAFLLSSAQNGPQLPFPTEDIAKSLENYAPARDWLKEVALGDSQDLNAKRVAFRACNGDPDVRAALIALMEQSQPGMETVQAIRAVAEEDWASKYVARFTGHKEHDVRLVAFLASFREETVPEALGNDTDQLSFPPRFQGSIEHDEVRKGLIMNIDRIPISPVAKADWLRKSGCWDLKASLRHLARRSLREAEHVPRTLRDEPAVAVPTNFSVSETSDPETFTTCISWLRRKLTSTLPDEIDWSEAASLSDSVEIYGEHLTEGVPDDIDLIRLAKDASELPRDRSIWPATNLVLAWTQARKLLAKSPRTLLLACADLHTKELVREIPQLNPGELVLGPVFFGFSLIREDSRE